MSSLPDTDQLSERIRAQLDDSLQDYDAATLSRLNQARQRALEALPHRTAPRWQWPAIGFAAALSLMLVLGWQRNPEPIGDDSDSEWMASVLSDDEMALLASDDELEMFQNLEFYAWLEQQQDWDGSSS